MSFDVLMFFNAPGLMMRISISFLKLVPAKKGDYLEFFCRDLIYCVHCRACPGGDLICRFVGPRCKLTHCPTCHPLEVEIYK